MKYLVYISAALMIILSFIPFYHFRNYIIKGFALFEGVSIQEIKAFMPIFCLAHTLPILGIFLSIVLIIWLHKE